LAVTIQLSVGELAILKEALRMAASRHISYGKWRPQGAGPHDRKADAMLTLLERLDASAAR